MKISILVSIIFFSCTSFSDSKFSAHQSPPLKTIKPGQVVRISFSGPPVKGAKLICRDKIFLHHYNGKEILAYISETYFSHFKPFQCTYGKRVVAKFKVKDKKFPEEELKVLRKKVRLSPKDQNRVAKEWAILKKIYENGVNKPLFTNSFEKPLNSFVTSIYGTRRTFNNIRRSQHLGTDFRAKIGTPIKISNKGKVVAAKDLFYSGKTVIVDHGMGIFTVYGHLSQIDVKEGDIVPENTIIGLSGKTGRITGPHLHWGVKVNGNYVDGDYLVNMGKKRVASGITTEP